MNKKIARFLAPAVLALTSASAPAAVVNISQTIDLNAWPTVLNGTMLSVVQGLGTPPIVALAVGDRVNVTYDFLGSQTLRMFGPSAIVNTLQMVPEPGCLNATSTSSLAFIGLAGPGTNVAADTQGSSCSSISNGFADSQFLTGPGMLEFSGLSFSLTVDAFNAGTSHSYAGTQLMLIGTRFEIGPAAQASVPEPASLALLGLGLLGIFGARRAGRV